MIKIDFDKCYGFKPHHMEKLMRAQIILDKVLESEQFKTRVLARTFKETDGKTNQQVLETMLSDCTIRVSRYYRWWSKVVGWTSGGGIIHVNGKFFDVGSATDCASNLLHETAHYLGFSHRVKPWGKTVPYSMNDILEDVVKDLGLEDA